MTLTTEIGLFIASVGRRADETHRRVNQYFDDKPYIYHLREVAIISLDFLPETTPMEDVKAVLFGAYFHDSIEDARLTYHDVLRIAEEYLDKDAAFMAAEIVYALTNEKGRNRAERANDKYYEGIRTTPYASIVKMADRIANMTYACGKHSSMEKAYKKEREHFIEAIVDTKATGKTAVPEAMVKHLKEIE